MKNKHFHSYLTILSQSGESGNPQPPPFPDSPQKPQISSIPGTSPKQRDRYRVILGGEILGERLTLDQALALAKRGERNAKNFPKSDLYS